MHIIFWEVWFGHCAKLGICRLSDKVCCSYDRKVCRLVERALVLESDWFWKNWPGFFISELCDLSKSLIFLTESPIFLRVYCMSSGAHRWFHLTPPPNSLPLFSALLHRWRYWGTERWSNLLKVTQLRDPGTGPALLTTVLHHCPCNMGETSPLYGYIGNYEVRCVKFYLQRDASCGFCLHGSNIEAITTCLWAKFGSHGVH